MLVDIELDVVPLHDSGQRGELLLRSVNQREADSEVHLAGTHPPRMDRPLKLGSDDVAEDLERLIQPHPA